MKKQTVTWQYNTPKGLNKAQFDHELKKASALYKARIGHVAPEPEHRETSNSVVLAFGVEIWQVNFFVYHGVSWGG